MKISQIISSYNRPAQLNLLLNSINDQWPECDQVTVLWRADNEFYGEGYKKLYTSFLNKNVGQNPLWGIYETNYKEDLLRTIEQCPNDYILMNSDDNVFINRVDFKGMDSLMDNHVAFSLRLGDNINYCLPAKLDIKKPNFYWESNDFIGWDWMLCDQRGAYGYSQPYDSNIYRKDWLINLIKDANFKNPFTLEVFMNEHRDNHRPHMCSFKEPKLISVQANTCGQNDNPNMKGNGQSLEMLNENYLNGWQISADGLYGMKSTQAHVFHDYKFERSQ